MDREARPELKPQYIRGLARRNAMLSLRRNGYGFSQIGKQFNVTSRVAAATVAKALAEMREEGRQTVEDIREMELQRLDLVLLSLSDRVKKGDTAAIDRWIRTVERRCKILGLDRVDEATSDAITRKYEGIDVGDV